MPSFLLAMRCSARSCCRIPLTVTALRSFAVLTSSTANAWIGESRPTDSRTPVVASAIFRTKESLHWGAWKSCECCMSHAELVGFSEQKGDLVRAGASEFGGLSFV